MYRSRAYQKIKVFNAIAGLPQSYTFHGENPTDRLFQWYDFIETVEKALQSLFSTLWIRGAVHAVIEFCKRYDAQPDPLRQQLVESLDDLRYPIHVIDDPTGVHEVPHPLLNRADAGAGATGF